MNIKIFSKFKQKHGATMVEYTLLVALIGLVAVTAMISIGVSVDSMFDNVSEDVDAAGN